MLYETERGRYHRKPQVKDKAQWMCGCYVGFDFLAGHDRERERKRERGNLRAFLIQIKLEMWEKTKKVLFGQNSW